MREDAVTNTPADAATYEHRRAIEEDPGYLPSACGERVTADDVRGEDRPWSHERWMETGNGYY